MGGGGRFSRGAVRICEELIGLNGEVEIFYLVLLALETALESS